MSFLVARLVRGALAIAVAATAIILTSRIHWDAGAIAGVAVVPATGGASISLDGTTDGGTASCTPIVGPVITEQASGDIGTGSMSLAAPAGFEFCPGGSATVSAVGLTTTLNVASTSVSREPNGTASVNVASASTGNSVGRITFTGLSVRPTNRVPTTGSISIGGQSVGSLVTGGGSLSSVPGAATVISNVSGTFADGTVRSSVATIMVQISDEFGNVRTNDSSTQVTLGLIASDGSLVDSGGTSYSEYLYCQTGRVGTLVAGIASFSQCVVTRSGTGWRLQASAPGVPTWTSTAAFSAFARVPSSLAFGTASASFQYINLANVAAVPAVVGFPSGGVTEPGRLTVVLTDRLGRTATGEYSVPLAAQASQSVEGPSIDATSLVDGSVTSTIKFVSTVGAQSSPLVTGATLVKDTVAPFAPDTTKLTVTDNSSGVADSLSGVPGAVEALSTVAAFESLALTSAGAPVTALADASGAFSSITLGANGETTASGTFGLAGFYVTASDVAGNRSPASFVAVDRDANPLPQSARVRTAAGTYDLINTTNATSVVVEVVYTGAPEAGSVALCLSDTTRPANGTFDLCVSGSSSWGVTASAPVVSGSVTTVLVPGVSVSSLTSGRIGIQVRHTDLAGNTKGEFTGVAAIKDVATSDPPTSMRVKSGASNDQDAINLASRTSVYVDVGFATAPAETGLLSVRMSSAGTGGSCSEVSGFAPVSSSLGAETNIVVGPMNGSCLADGVVTVSAAFADSAGNGGAFVIGSTTAVKDTVAPAQPSLTAMTLTSNAPGTPDSLVVSSSVGGASDITQVWRDAGFTSLISSGPASGGLTVSLGDNYETSAGRTGLSAVYVSVVDAVGNQSSPTEVVVDNVANAGPRSVRVQDEDPPISPTQTTLVFAFVAPPETGSLEVSVGGAAPVSIAADTSRTETVVTPVLTSLLSALPVSIGVRHLDTAGNSVATSTFSLVDAQAPGQPSAPAIEASQVVTVAGLPTTSLRRPTFVGSVEAGAQVTLYEGGSVIGSGSSSGTLGGYSVVPSVDLADGAHSLTIRATDLSGNVSRASDAYAYSVDATNPTSGSISLDPSADLGLSVTDRTTSQTLPTFSVTGASDTGSGIASVQLQRASAGSGWSFVDSGLPSTSLVLGAYPLQSTALIDAEYRVQAVVTDKAGRQSTTEAITVTVDGSAPVPGTISMATGSDTGTSASDAVTNVATPSFLVTGAGDTGSGIWKVQLRISPVGGGLLSDVGNPTVLATAGVFDLPMPSMLADGAYDISAKVFDVAGNEASTTTLSIRVDTTVPTPGTLTLTDTYGVSFADGLVSVATPEFTLTGMSDAGAGLASARLEADGVVSGSAVTIGSTTSYSLSSASLTSGTYSVRARVTDIAGKSMLTEPVVVKVDLLPPTPGSLAVVDANGVAIVSPVLPSRTVPLKLSAATDTFGIAGAVAQISTDSGSTWSGSTAFNGSEPRTATLALAPTGTFMVRGLVTDNAGLSATTNPITVVVDTDAPTITGVTTTASGSKKAGDTVVIGVTFSEPVSSTGTSQLQLETGSTDRTATCPAVTVSVTLHCTYTVLNGDASVHLDYASTSALTGIIVDTAGNAAVLTLPSLFQSDLYTQQTIVIDTAAPTVSGVTTSVSSGTYGIGAVIPIDVIFTEGVVVDTSGGTPQLTLATGGSGRTVNYATGSGTATLTFRYTVTRGETSAGLDVAGTSALTLNGATVRDQAGNDAVLTLLPTGSLRAPGAIAVDTTVPTVTSVTTTVPDGSYRAGSVIPVLVTFSEPVTVSGTVSLLLETGQVDRQVVLSGGSGTTTLEFQYTVQTGDTSADLEYGSVTSLSVSGGAISDVTENEAAYSLPVPATPLSLAGSASIVIDTTPPAPPTNVSLTTATDTGPSPTDGVTNVTAVSVTGTAETASVVTLFDNGIEMPGASGTASNGTFTIATTLSIGNHGITAKATDAAGNTGNASMTLPVTVDQVAPTVISVSSTTPSGAYRAGTTIPIYVSFSEPMTVVGTPRLSMETGLVDTVAAYVSGSGTSILRFDYVVAPGDTSPQLDYVDTTALSAGTGSIGDAAGNAATLTLPGTGTGSSLVGNVALAIDTDAPTVTRVDAVSPNGTYYLGKSVSISITFSDPVYVSGSPYLSLSGGGVAGYASGSGTAVLNFIYGVGRDQFASRLDYSGTSGLGIPTGSAIADAAGNLVNATLAVPGSVGSISFASSISVEGRDPPGPEVPTLLPTPTRTPVPTPTVSQTVFPVQAGGPVGIFSGNVPGPGAALGTGVVPADATAVVPATVKPVEPGVPGAIPRVTPTTLVIPSDPGFASPIPPTDVGSVALPQNPVYGSIIGSFGASGVGAGPPTVLASVNVTDSTIGRPVERFQMAGSGGQFGLAVAVVPSGAIGVVGLGPDGGSVMMVGETVGGTSVVVGVQTSPEFVASIRSRFAGADVEAIFDPAPNNLSDVQLGSLGGGTTTPAGAPFDLQLRVAVSGRPIPEASRDSTSFPTVTVHLPINPNAGAIPENGVFAWLVADYGSDGEFIGYLRPQATFNPETNSVSMELPLDRLQGTLFLPVFLTPSWVQSTRASARIYGGPMPDAVAFGLAGPQFTVFPVVAPQVAGRIKVFNPVTEGYGWIDASDVGPAIGP